MFDELVAFFRPTYSYVREEKLRLELTREDAGDATPRLNGGDAQFTMSIPEDYEPPSGPRVRGTPRDSQGLVV